MSNAASLIAESVAANSTVRAYYSPKLALDLSVACEDSVECLGISGPFIKYLGTTDGAKWRVHLAR